MATTLESNVVKSAALVQGVALVAFPAAGRARMPARFWIFAAFALCYGVCETMNGNWASIDMTKLGASTTQASVALTVFWAFVTLGRIGVAAIARWVSSVRVYHVPAVRARGSVRRDRSAAGTIRPRLRS